MNSYDRGDKLPGKKHPEWRSEEQTTRGMYVWCKVISLSGARYDLSLCPAG